MPHRGIDVDTTPINLDATHSLSTSQAYSIQCTARHSYIEEQKQQYEVRVLLATAAPTDMDQAFKDAMVIAAKGSPFTYRPKTGEACYVWCHYGPSRISLVEKDTLEEG